MSVLKLKDYIAKTEGDDEFIDKEIRRFEKHLPAFSKVVIHERDEYIAQTLCEVARAGYGSNPDPKVPAEQRCIIAVVGAAHLPGIEKWLRNGGSTQERMQEKQQANLSRMNVCCASAVASHPRRICRTRSIRPSR